MVDLGCENLISSLHQLILLKNPNFYPKTCVFAEIVVPLRVLLSKKRAFFSTKSVCVRLFLVCETWEISTEEKQAEHWMLAECIVRSQACLGHIVPFGMLWWVPIHGAGFCSCLLIRKVFSWPHMRNKHIQSPALFVFDANQHKIKVYAQPFLISPPRMVCARQPHCLGCLYSLCPRPFPQNNDFPLDLLP